MDYSHISKQYIDSGGNWDILTTEAIALLNKQLEDNGCVCCQCGGKLSANNFDGPIILCENDPKWNVNDPELWHVKGFDIHIDHVMVSVPRIVRKCN